MNFMELSTKMSAWGREKMHAPFYCYPNVEQAKNFVREGSGNCRSLNGVWQIAVYPSVEETPIDWFVKPESTQDMPVPANWEFHGVGQPVYTNTLYPFDLTRGDHSFEVQVTEGNYILNAPFIPKDNLNVCYYTAFFLTENELSRRVILQFGGVETAFELAVNGKVIGFSQDSKLEAEFDVTPYVKAGKNNIAVRVYEFSAHSYIEDQDYWHVHGIQRDVTLRFQSRSHMEDFKVRPEFGKTMTDAALLVKLYPNRKVDLFGEDYCVLHLFDPNGTKIHEETLKPFAEYGGYLVEDYTPEVRISVDAPALWDTEQPDLYTLVIEQKNKNGETIDIESARVGFREIRIEDGVLEINRNRMTIRGTDLHEWSSYTGRYVSEEELRATLMKIRDLNFNAIRTCHYPKADLFYDMCDKMGIYVVDETNLETHGYGGALSCDPEWTHAYMDAAIRMCIRDKNHPCVIVWSLGNESGAGTNHGGMYGWLKEYDTRPVQYESNGSKPSVSDIRCDMYPNEDWILTCLASDEKRPYIMCEYAYAKSNSNGNLDVYWDKIRAYTRFQGGFVWDFQDKAMPQYDAEGKMHFRYAGAFGESVQDPVPDMCLNGVVYPDLSEKPQAKEMKNIQAPIQISYTDWHGMGGRYVISNEYHRTNLNRFTCTYELVCCGHITEHGTIPLSVPPMETAELVLPYDRSLVYGEAFVNIYVCAEDGHEIYRKQIPAEGSVKWSEKCDVNNCETADMAENMSLNAADVRNASVSITRENAEVLVIEADSRTLTFNKTTGAFENEEDLLFRAPTGIDEACGTISHNQEWIDAGLYAPAREISEPEVLCSETKVLIHTEVSYQNGSIRIEKHYTVTASGVELSAVFHNRTGILTLPRIGVGLTLPKTYENVRWYGRGPWENYIDRKASAFVGLYESSITDMHEDYIRCCECGGREDTRWLILTDAEGRGIRVTGSGDFHFSALPWTPADYLKADYVDELPERTVTYLSLDALHAGLGGDTGWTKNIHEEYRIPDGDYSYSFKLSWI